MTTDSRTFKCPECGDVPLNHRLEKLSQTADLYLRSFFLTRFLFDLIDPWVNRIGVEFASSGTFFRLLQFGVRHGICRVTTDASTQTNTRVLALYEGALAAGVTLSQYSFLKVPLCFVAERGGERNIFRVIPRPNGFVSPSLLWMDNKGILKEKMEAAGIPHADGGVARTWKEALAIFKKVNAPVIVKPYVGSRGRHTTLDIRTEAELRRGFDIAMQITTHAVIERYLHGTVHRVTLVGGKPVAVARREYPHVTGDGVHTVDALIDTENKNPLRHSSHFRPLDKYYRVDESLRKQGLTRESIPETGKMVIISDKNSRLHGTVTEDITDKVHPENMKLFEHFGEVLGDPIVGVDFMIHDMSRSWKEQPESGALECNSMPFIDVHHQVVSGRAINVAAHLWEVIFPARA